MSFETVQRTLEKTFGDAWADTTDIAYENVPFNPTRGEAWVRFTVIMGAGNQAALGGTLKQYRNVGIITVSVFVPENSGTRTAKGLAATAGEIFRAQQLTGNIQCRSPGITEIGFNEGWHQVNVDIPFQWDEFI